MSRLLNRHSRLRRLGRQRMKSFPLLTAHDVHHQCSLNHRCHPRRRLPSYYHSAPTIDHFIRLLRSSTTHCRV